MPGGDRTGPKGLGPGRGQGRGSGRGQGGGGRGQDGGGGGRGGGFGAGPGGLCICPNCGEKATHQLGTPCYEQKCPKCGAAMTRG